MSSNQKQMTGCFATWMGLPVFLNVTTGNIKTSIFCTIISESDATVRVRIADEWDVDIYKEMIRAVDAFPHEAMDPSPQSPERGHPAGRLTDWYARGNRES